MLHIIECALFFCSCRCLSAKPSRVCSLFIFNGTYLPRNSQPNSICYDGDWERARQQCHRNACGVDTQTSELQFEDGVQSGEGNCDEPNRFYDNAWNNRERNI